MLKVIGGDCNIAKQAHASMGHKIKSYGSYSWSVIDDIYDTNIDLEDFDFIELANHVKCLCECENLRHPVSLNSGVWIGLVNHFLSYKGIYTSIYSISKIANILRNSGVKIPPSSHFTHTIY